MPEAVHEGLQGAHALVLRQQALLLPGLGRQRGHGGHQRVAVVAPRIVEHRGRVLGEHRDPGRHLHVHPLSCAAETGQSLWAEDKSLYCARMDVGTSSAAAWQGCCLDRAGVVRYGARCCQLAPSCRW